MLRVTAPKISVQRSSNVFHALGRYHVSMGATCEVRRRVKHPRLEPCKTNCVGPYISHVSHF